MRAWERGKADRPRLCKRVQTNWALFPVGARMDVGGFGARVDVGGFARNAVSLLDAHRLVATFFLLPMNFLAIFGAVVHETAAATRRKFYAVAAFGRFAISAHLRVTRRTFFRRHSFCPDLSRDRSLPLLNF